MDVGSVISRNFILERILCHLGSEDLFSCAEVNRAWQSVAVPLLQKKLLSISVCCGVDPEELLAMAPVPSMHSSIDIFCNKVAKILNISRMAGMRPCFGFLSCYADLLVDRRGLADLCNLLPSDCLVVYFKLAPEGHPNAESEEGYLGIIAELLFRPEDIGVGFSLLEDTTRSEGEQQPADAPEEIHCSRSYPLLEEGSGDHAGQPASSVAALMAAPGTPGAELVCKAAAPQPFLWPRTPVTPVSGNGGAIFENVMPGVLMYQALDLTVDILEGNAATSLFTEQATRKTMQVTSVAVCSGMRNSSLQEFMRSLSDGFGAATNTIVVAYARNPDKAMRELVAFRRIFQNVPLLAIQAAEFRLDSHYAPLESVKLILLLMKLLD